MSEAPAEFEEGRAITVGQGNDPSRDLWMVMGPYWDDGKPGAYQDAFDIVIEGKADAMEYANDKALEHPGCVIHVYDKNGTRIG